MQYMVDILNLSHLHDWLLVYGYDLSFRFDIQENLAKSWGVIDHLILSQEIISPSMLIVGEKTKKHFSP